MIKNIIFDFGGVLVDWNPGYFYSSVFEDKSEMEYFLTEICSPQWNSEHDRGVSYADNISQALHPEYGKEIGLFHRGWSRMLRSEIPGSVAVLKELYDKGYHIYGLTNWSAETIDELFRRFSFFSLMKGIIVSGREKIIKPDSRIYNIILHRYVLFALLILVGLLRFLPEIAQERDDKSRKGILRDIIRNRNLLMIYLITAAIITGHYTGYSYIEPFMERILHMNAEAITCTLCLFGLAGLIGSFVMNRFYRRHSVIMIKAACICLPATMLALLPASDFGIIVLSALCMLWGMALTIYNIAFQSEVMEHASHNQAVAMSIYSGIRACLKINVNGRVA